MFRIEYHFTKRDPPMVIARQLEPASFSIGPTSRLGGAALQHVLTQPRKLLPDGTLDLEVFVFQLESTADLSRIPVGADVELVP